jgi:hypothetical protein
VFPNEVIKGKIDQSLIFSIGSTSNCDYFAVPVNRRIGERHLVYLRHQEHKLKASICSLSGPLGKKAVELEALRKQFKQNAQQGAPGDAPKAARP